MTNLCFHALDGIPEICPGDDLIQLLADALDRSRLTPRDHDVLVVSQKIVSKAEGRYVMLAEVAPSAQALEIARQCGKDSRLVELVMRQSREVVRVAHGVLIVRHNLGFVVANAGIDQSNLPEAGGGADQALLLPHDPDISAELLRRGLEDRFGVRLAVLISDSFGRPWRNGVCGTCIGCSGMAALLDRRGERDRAGRPLQVTQIAAADEVCAAAALVSGEAAEGRPAILVRGVPDAYFEQSIPASALLRPIEQDLFR